MSLRTALALLLLTCAALAWLAFRPTSIPATAAIGHGTTLAQASRCPLPPRVERGATPLQSAVPDGVALPAIEGASVTPLAGFSVEARVLSREDYGMGREAEFSPIDLALGWGRMTDDAVLSQLDISQGGRWYRYSWRDAPPIPLDEIVRSSANMHMIPADDAVAAALDRIERGERVRIDGWLVQIDAGRWRWRSSLTREDSGGGACELVYVCAVTRE
ncbi:hypothetical protein [Thermomonas aquatica]|uniref:Uncharacterized protein n=1 Tax=Thermomonas aquatica TaxID=2202149 RepID=A0A5B7ZPS1_9GAMM|nr:hypothetical protein [Thermomonas aquatica]QDA56749.1 hypothetical protein FHQ07_05165 [Thermomonas aquatica]